MRKITRLLAIAVALFWTGNVFAAQVPTYLVNENFDGKTSLPSGWAVGTVSSVGAFGVSTDRLNFSASGSGNRGAGLTGITATTALTSTEVHYDFDYCPNSPTVRQLNLTIRDNSKQAIVSLIIGGDAGSFNWGGRMLLVNRDTTIFKNQFKTNADILLDVPDQLTNYTSGTTTYAANTTAVDVQTATANTWLGANFTLAKTYSINAVLNFVTKKIISITITDKADATTTVTYTDLPFINSSATNLTNLDFVGTRPNAASTSVAPFIDNLKIYTLAEAPTSIVTINYLNPDGVAFKTTNGVANQIIGTTYTALASDKATYTDGSFYYIYDAINTTADNVVVLSDGSATINLKFSKIAATAGTYTWTGATNGNWNDTEANFSTDGLNSLAYQNSNAIAFTDVAVQKTINQSGALNLGAGNIDLAGDGYTINGTGSISGTGMFNLNLTTGQTAILGLTNNLTGGVAVNGGTAVISANAAGANYTVSNGSALNLSTGVAFSKAIAGVAGTTFTIVPTSNVAYTSAITGVDAVNYSLVSAGSVNTSGVFSAIPTLNNTASGNINVNTTLGAATMFPSTVSFGTNKLNLGDNVNMVYSVNPAADGSTIVGIGELTGSSLSKIQGPRLRTLTYSIGGLNTNSTFAGTFENFPADNWTNIPVLNVSKTGTGILNLTGNSVGFNTGNVNVTAGKLVVTGALGTITVPVTVAVGATLAGIGTIGGATTVNGTLEGALNFGSSLALAGTTNVVVNGFNAGEFDVINVTGAVTFGGVLNVTVNGANPTIGTAIKIVNAATYAGDFTQPITAPANYSFNKLTGELTYDGTTGLGVTGADELSIYPTLTRGTITVAGNVSSVEIANLAGQVVKQVNLTNGNSNISLSNLSTGAYFVTARSIDGSTKVQKVIYQK